MERSIGYAQIHGEKILKENSEKLITECTSESPNAFWHREKYFVYLPYDPLVKITPQKASAALMSPTKIQTCQQEINDLLHKGLIEPSNIAWVCRGFYVNKHSEKKRGKLMIQMDIGGHPPFPTGSKQFSDIFGNLLFLAVFTFRAILRA
jgi:hypothetical protein